MDYEEQSRLLAPSPEHLASVKVFPLIPHLKKDVIKTIDGALSWEQLTASDINFSVVRPLVSKYARLRNMAVVYACLVVRSYFLSAAEQDLAFCVVMISRATLCEILAMKLLAHFASNHIQLVAVLTTSWNLLAGAPSHVVEEVKQALGGDGDDMNYPQSALEMAISTKAKAFLSSPVSQKVINDIYSGNVVFSMTANRSLLADNYKPRAIELYDYRAGPFLNHYRLRVPKYGAVLEFMNFAILLITFVSCLSSRDIHQLVPSEIVFIIFASAFTLEEYTASTEHGWIIYMANMWNVFDTSFVVVFFAYMLLRIRGLVYDNVGSSELGFDILACGACILFPRLAFFAVSNNVVILSLRAMISEFVFFIAIASICFSGLLFTLWTLASDKWTVKAIAWLMVQIWFGNTYLSFGQASSFHPVFGPILMTGFAALSNTLLLTILISILSNTVARIDANATREYLFQFAIATIEGVKSDALFSYQPPFNLLAFIILKPASWFLSPRALHTANVFLIKLTSFPTLIAIAVYERHFSVGQGFRESGKGAAYSFFNSLPRQIKHMPILEALVGSNSSDLYDAIFDVDVTGEFDLFEDSDNDFPALRSLTSRESLQPGPERKRLSSVQKSPRREFSTSRGSPRLQISRNLSPIAMPATSTEISLGEGLKFEPPQTDTLTAGVDVSIKRVEALLDGMRDLPVQRLKDEMKELQDRQARIENLLLMLTRGMRNEIGHSARHDTLP